MNGTPLEDSADIAEVRLVAAVVVAVLLVTAIVLVQRPEARSPTTAKRQAANAAAHPASSVAPCEINTAAVVKRSAHAMLVRRGKERKHFWACLRGRQAVHVGYAGPYRDEDDEEYIGRYALGGRFVAISSYGCLEGCGDERVDLYDLRSRRLVRHFFLTSVAQLLVGTRGGVAVVTAGQIREFHGIRVWDLRGVTVVTRTPHKVALQSVRVAGNLLRWTQAGVERSFRMRSARRSFR